MVNIIVGLIVLACLAVAAWHIYKLFKGETSCCSTASTAPPLRSICTGAARRSG